MLHSLCRLLLILLMCVSLSGRVAADDDRDDSREKGSRQSEDFELTLTIPFLYSSSVVKSETDTVIRDVGDRHIDPDLALEWSRQFSSVNVSAIIAATFERYATVREANVDTLAAGVKTEFTDGKADVFVPYFEYEQTVDFRPLFAAREATLHDFAVGFTSGIGLDRDGELITYARADKPGRSSVELDVKAGRRLADPQVHNRVFVEVELDFEHIISEQWTVVVTPEFKVRWYDNYVGQSRRDYRSSLELKAEWEPDWLKKPLPEAKIEFSVLFERNDSTLVDKRYNLYELGPTVVLSSKF